MSANCVSACAIPFAFVVLMLLVWQKMQQERAQYEALHPSEKVVALTVIQAARLREEQVGFEFSVIQCLPSTPRPKLQTFTNPNRDTHVWTLPRRAAPTTSGAHDKSPLPQILYKMSSALNGVSTDESSSSTQWSPSSWRTKPIVQAIAYPNPTLIAPALSQLRTLPPMVTPTEIVKLRQHLRRVAMGEAFLLQGGDCAELFSYCSDGPIDAKIKLLLQMSLVLIWGANKPVVRIARMAGQYAKPRSSAMETLPDGTTIPSFRGDILNGFDREAREPNPGRLVQAYFHSAATLNFLRAQLSSGIADLHNPMDWGLGHVRDEKLQAQYTKIVNSITESLRFMRTIGADTAGQLETVELFTSHESLVLEYEEALTRRLPRPKSEDRSGSAGPALDDGKAWYNTSAHFLWIGDRTRQLTHGHVEYFRGIENPIGIKVGPSMASDELVRLLDIVNSDKEIGKVTLITRYGEGKVEDLLPGHIEAVRQSGHVVVWQCDPMHGNTLSTPTGIKTRHFSSILSEVSSALRIHQRHGSFLGGVHLELTGDAVTECLGGSEGLAEQDLSLNYTTYCDPRLNEKQALELAFLVAGFYRGESV